MAKPNYQYEKRRKELEKIKKREEKRKRKQAQRDAAKGTAEGTAAEPDTPDTGSEPAPE